MRENNRNLWKVFSCLSFLFCLTCLNLLSEEDQLVSLSHEKYIDKCKGAWLGQMIGVTFADRYEFRSNGIPILEPLEEWKPEDLKRAFPQDDLYVEMTFLEALEQKGINISHQEAGKFFAESKYPLWHANKAGRENLRKGILPPLSGHPDYNLHADDIDFQIESDLFGIICPGLPKESQRLGKVFGSIMNYGDGLYGGLFIAGMYSSAFFKDDILEVIQAGLQCIPPESTYRKCIEDTIESWKKYPDNWLETWKFVEQKWQDDVDCLPGNLVNIDAKINGAYVVIGLLYGKGDMLKTLEIATRCGQDTDCNASSAGGILGCIKGFSNLEEHWKSYLPNLLKEKFLFTNYSWNTLIDACDRMAQEIVKNVGGRIENGHFYIPLQNPTPPPTLEQWTNKKEIFKPPIMPEDVKKWSEFWKVKSCKKSPNTGVFTEESTGTIYLSLAQPEPAVPALIESNNLPISNPKSLVLEVRTPKNEEFTLRFRIDYHITNEQKVNSSEWNKIVFEIPPGNTASSVLTVELFSPAENATISLKPPVIE